MRKFRTFTVSLLLALGGLAANADDYQFLTVVQSGGEVSYSVSSISKITFDATNMIFHLADGNEQTIPLQGLSKMFFTGDPSAIAAVTETASKIQFADGMLRAVVASGEHLTLYNMKGEQVFSSNETGTFDLKNLMKGVYIVKVGRETKKVMNR